MSSHELSLRLRQYAEIFNNAPSEDAAERHALTRTASDLLEAARRLDQNHARAHAQ